VQTLICTAHIVLYKSVSSYRLNDPIFDSFVIPIAVSYLVCAVSELNIVVYYGLSGAVKRCLHPILDGCLLMLLKTCLS